MSNEERTIEHFDAEKILGRIASDALQHNYESILKWAKSAPITMRAGVPVVAICNQEIKRGFQMLAIYGVPQERARYIHNGIDVLMTRVAKEAHLQAIVMEDVTKVLVEYGKKEEGQSARNILNKLGKGDLLK